MEFQAGVITVSDRSYQKEREDQSGPLIVHLLGEKGIKVVASRVVPDEGGRIREALLELINRKEIHLLLTTGGTGLGPRDITPDITKEILEKDIPGIVEYMRFKSMKKTPYGMLSRAMAGIRDETLIINLPGSPKAVEECLVAILPAIPHALELIKGRVKDCPSP